MTLLIKKSIRELVRNKTQTIMTLLAMIIGITTFGAVVICYSLVARDLPLMHKSTNSPSFTIETSAVTDDLIDFLAKSPEVDVFEVSAHYPLRISSESGESFDLDLFAYNDPSAIKMNQYDLVQGDFPNEGEIILENLCLDVANVEIGDALYISGKQSPQIEFTLVGSVHDISQHPANYHREVYGYISKTDLESMGLSMNKVLIQTPEDPYSEPMVNDYAASLTRRLEAAGFFEVTISHPDFLGESPHAHEYTPITSMIQIVGIILYLLAALMINNLLSMMLSKQTKQVGIIKSIGGSRRHFLVVNLLMVVIMSLIALVIAAPLSIVAGKFLTSFLLGLGNYTMIDPSLPTYTLLLILTFSFIVPIALSLSTIVKSANTSILNAFNSLGIEQRLRVPKWIIRITKNLPLLMRKGIRRIFANSRVVAATVIMMVLGGALYLCASITEDSLSYTIDETLKRHDYDYEFSAPETFETVIKANEDIRSYEKWYMNYAKNITSDGETTTLNLVYPPMDTKLFEPVPNEGRWLISSKGNQIVMNKHVSDLRGNYHIGDNLLLQIGNDTITFEIVGFINESGFSNHYAYMEDLPKVTLPLYKIDFSATQPVEQAISHLESYDDEGMITYSHNIKQYLESYEDNSREILGFFRSASIMMLVVGGISLASTLSIQVLGRRREIAIMASIGGQNHHVRNIILFEASTIGLMAWVGIVILTFALAALVNYLLGTILFGSNLMLFINPLHFLTMTGFIIIIVLVASNRPIKLVQKATLKESLSYE